MGRPTEEELKVISDNISLLLNHHYKWLSIMLTNLTIVFEVEKFLDQRQKFQDACESASNSLRSKKISLSPDAIRVRYYRMLKRNSHGV